MGFRVLLEFFILESDLGGLLRVDVVVVVFYLLVFDVVMYLLFCRVEDL